MTSKSGKPWALIAEDHAAVAQKLRAQHDFAQAAGFFTLAADASTRAAVELPRGTVEAFAHYRRAEELVRAAAECMDRWADCLAHLSRPPAATQPGGDA